MKPLEPVLVTHLFPDERAALLDVLRSLDAEQWERPTVCAGWSVGDIARHLVADDLGRLSRERDDYTTHGFTASSPEAQRVRGTFESELLTFIDAANEAWVAAARRLSPAIVIDLLEWSGREPQAYFESLDLQAIGDAVTWAGPEPAPKWLDIAREYTERWHHQAQIREGAGLPLLSDSRLFAPVLAAFVLGVPHAFRDTDADEGTHVRLRITGDAGGEWSLVRSNGRWMLVQPLDADAAATVEIGQDAAWRTFTKGLTPQEAKESARIEGDGRLAEQVLRTVSIIA
jgi:uncharacterized protein (TIGR03083 family)